MTRALTVLALVGVGAVTGVATVAFNSETWGLVLGLAATLTTLYAVRPGARRIGFALGWLAVVAQAVLGRPEGDWVVASDTHGWTLIGSSVAVLVFALVSLPPPGESGNVVPTL